MLAYQHRQRAANRWANARGARVLGIARGQKRKTIAHNVTTNKHKLATKRGSEDEGPKAGGWDAMVQCLQRVGVLRSPASRLWADARSQCMWHRVLNRQEGLRHGERVADCMTHRPEICTCTYKCKNRTINPVSEAPMRSSLQLCATLSRFLFSYHPVEGSRQKRGVEPSHLQEALDQAVKRLKNWLTVSSTNRQIGSISL